MFDVKKMASDLELDEQRILEKLGLLQPKEVRTFEEARDLYNRSFKGTHNETLAIEALNRFGLEKAKIVTTLDEALELFEDTIEGSEAQQAVTAVCMKLISNLADARRLFDSLPSDSKTYTLAMNACLSFVTTFEEAWELYNVAVSENSVDRPAFYKCIELATTTSQIMRLHNIVPGGSDEEKITAEKWNSIALIELQKVKTRQEAYGLYKSTLEGTYSQKIASETCNRLTMEELQTADNTLKQILELYDSTPEGTEANLAALEKLAAYYGYEKK